MNEILTYSNPHYLGRAYQIAEELDCKLSLEPGLYPQYFLDEDSSVVFAPPPTDQFSFLVLLHELGHVKLKHVQEIGTVRSNSLWIPPDAPRIAGTYFTNGILRSETQAWRFALENLHELLEEVSKLQIKSYLGTYLKEAERAKDQLWHIRRPGRFGIGIWTSPAFKFDSPDYALGFLSLLDELEILTWTN